MNRPPSVAELRTGVEPLQRLLGLLPQLQVVLLLGTHAQLSWNLLLLQAHPGVGSDLTVLSSRHPGRQAFIGTTGQRAQWREDQAVSVT